MSDSDETVCNEGSNGESESEGQNSPSILSSWYQTNGKRKDESLQENIGSKQSRTNPLKIDANDFSRVSSSPEYPLLSRAGLKRKETSQDSSILFREELGFLDSDREGKRKIKDVRKTDITETSNETLGVTCVQATLSASEGDGLTGTEALLANLETVMRELETEQTNGGTNGRLEYVKAQLTGLQKALVEVNHKNQVARKKIISTEGCQQLSEQKKVAILSLAKKQRNVLEVFKKYKNMVQRLKELKEQKHNASKEKYSEEEGLSISYETSGCAGNTEDLSVKSNKPPGNPEVSVAALPRIKTSIKEVIMPTKLSAHQSHPGVTFVVESLPENRPEKNPSVNPVPITIVPSSSGESISANVASLPVYPPVYRSKTHITMQPNQATTNQSAKIQSIALPTTLETSLANAIPISQAQPPKTYHTSSGPAIIHGGLTCPETATTNTTAIVYSTNTHSLGCTWSDVSSNPRTSQFVQVPSQNRQKTHHTSGPSSILTGTFPSTEIMHPTNINSPGLRCSNVPSNPTMATSICIQGPSESRQKAHSSSGPFQTTAINYSTNNPGSCTRSTGAPTTRATTSQCIQDPPQSRQRVQRELPNCTTVEQCNKTASTVGNSQSNINQSLTALISGTPLTLETLVKKGVLASGRNVLTATAEGKLYSASLSQKGTIISAGGEGFTSPRSWVKAILGSKRKVKHDVAWKMVSYEGRSLLDFAKESITEPQKTEPQLVPKTVVGSSSVPKNVDCVATHNEHKNQTVHLINSRAALTALLRTCRVAAVEKEELVPSREILTKDFWEKTEFELESLNKDVLFGLEFS